MCIRDSNDGKADFGKRLAPALDIAVGKWFTPGIGLRLAYNGLQALSLIHIYGEFGSG